MKNKIQLMSILINKLRTLLFSPKSRLELILRTFYHKMASTKALFFIQNFLANQSYKQYRAQRRKPVLAIHKPKADEPKITFLLAWSGAQNDDLEVTLRSIQNLQGNHWDVITIPSLTEDHPAFTLLDKLRIKWTQPRHQNLLNHIDSDYVLFCMAGDVFSVDLLAHFNKFLLSEDPKDVIYYDSEYIDIKSNSLIPLFKPETLSPALLLSVNYLSHAFINLKSFSELWPKIKPNNDFFSQAYELSFRLYEEDKTFGHIPVILLNQKEPPVPTTQAQFEVITNHLNRMGLSVDHQKRMSRNLRVGWKYGSPDLAIIILSKNNPNFLKSLIPSLKAQQYDGEFSIHIVDNGSEDPQTLEYYNTLNKEEAISIIPYPKKFNYSEAINLGVSNSSSDLVLLLNDDMAAMDNFCLSELAQWAIKPKVGVVGGKLLRRNHIIQHAGIVMGIAGFAGHIYLNAPENYHGLFGSVNWFRNYLALTGACQMMRREIFNQVGGYDEEYILAFGDVDFCIKVYNEGYQNIYTPFARFFHYEGSSRGYQTPTGDILRGYNRIEPFLTAGDPFFSPSLTCSRIPKCVTKNFSKEDRIKQVDTRKNFYLKHK